jgi:hypothetical protein
MCKEAVCARFRVDIFGDMKNYQFTMLCGVAFHAEANYSPPLRLMTSDRFRATGETILIA